MGGPGSGRRKSESLDHAVAAASGPTTTSQIQVPMLGSQPLVAIPPDQLSPGELNLVTKMQSAFKQAFLGNKNPMWNDQEELNIMRMVSFQGSTQPTGSVGINERFSKRYPVSDLNIPRNPLAVVQLSLKYAMENPFVAKALRVKADFTCKDFVHKTHKPAAKKFYDDYALALKLRTRLPKIAWNLFATGLCPIYWGGEDGGQLQFIQILNPASVHLEDIMGTLKMWLKITPRMVDAVRDPSGQENPSNKAQYESMPPYWITQILAAIKKGQAQGLIELQEGSYTVLDYRYCPYNRSDNTLDGVPLQGCFDALQRYRLLAAGDFAVAWNVKNMLTLISEGDPNADPKDYKPADNVRLEKLRQQFSHPDYALTIFCDPTTTVRYVVPPIEVFDPKKYEQVEKEIKEVLNLPSFMWSNDGKGTFGAAQAEVQLLRQEVQATRLILEEQFFRPLYTRLRAGAGSRPGFAAADIPLPSFDQNSLRDDAIWLSTITDAYSRGVVSLETVCETLDLDFDYEIKQKQIEHEKYGNTSTGEPGTPMNDTPARPLFEPSQGNLNPQRDKGGNESQPGGEPGTSNRNPRKTGK